jgi:sulfite reductase alpha subunit-like flavoprotein
MDDYDVEELENEEMVYCIVATCGQGELPGNCKYFA